ncbi:OmpA family protein [Membranihabitans marinus]|uniref:OmpA family protein n=1 Tax=Membranihabitans marinus TaxID=1227546 RepID=UPI001F29DDB9|nr:OmpA family protein [Membranihabitans marinus]
MDIKLKLKIGYFLVILFLSPLFVVGQERIQLDNPSFEDYPKANTPPQGWTDCGFVGETPPDVQPSGAFGVFWPAMDGNTYLGMVARDNETYETVAQKLSHKLRAGSCYQISMFICKSSVYYSAVSDKLEEGTKNFISPIKMRIWGGYDMCSKKELIGETELVNNMEWMKQYVKLSPKAGDYSVLFLEAYYKTPVLFPYNGNILVDDLSDITLLDKCSDTLVTEDNVELPLATIVDPAEKIDVERRVYRINGKVENVHNRHKIYLAVNDLYIKNYTFNEKTGGFSALVILSEGKNEIKLIGSNEAGTDTDSTVIHIGEPKRVVTKIQPKEGYDPPPMAYNKTEVVVSNYGFSRKEDKKVLKPGDIIQLDHLQFKANSSFLSDEDSAVLSKLLKFLEDYPSLKVEIGGHTNGIPDWDSCIKLSSERAMAVAEYLIKNGISHHRLRAVGYGKKYPIASNKTLDGRKKNQRVEIKILDLGG